MSQWGALSSQWELLSEQWLQDDDPLATSLLPKILVFQLEPAMSFGN